ncbi:MAG: hypothetical protein OXH27_08195 [Gammaproteobacteria bacterium]|nr:hypothetical protein [Gammaproteobacteria bacterium]MCY3690190.1 hypothetical protein [Gammaproteobacteria bacterium]MDE0479711.1 hypothetical protein [Gammaproteobacteria bacterium]MXX06069.1 hypothetical protein [Gammaproteobacteria bacterium]MXY91347.1 hypothetical protein [Gammaproteobacteria bacterium]
MAKYYASNPVDGLVPLNGETLMEAIEDAANRDWKFTDGTIPIFDGSAKPIAWMDPEDCAWTLTPPATWWPAKSDSIEAREKNIRH